MDLHEQLPVGSFGDGGGGGGAASASAGGMEGEGGTGGGEGTGGGGGGGGGEKGGRKAGGGRVMCEGCKRAMSVCLCPSLPNPKIRTTRMRVLIMQHPEEVKESKGTVPLCQLSMDQASCSVIVGRRFDHENLPARVLSAANDRGQSTTEWRRTLLLWPSGEIGSAPELLSNSRAGHHGVLDEVLSGSLEAGDECLILVLDATWSSAQQMLNVSPLLHNLRRIRIEPSGPSMYTIRVQQEPHFRSTLESIAEIIGLAEGDEVKKALLAPMIHFVAKQEEYIQARGGHRVRKAQGDAANQQQKSKKRDQGKGQHEIKTERGDVVDTSGGTGVWSVGEARVELERVRKNKAALLGFLVRLAQSVEREWRSEDLRMERLELYRECLLQMGDSEDMDLRELGRLGPKMKTLDFDLSHFLKMALPVERKHSRGLKDHEFMVETDDRQAAAYNAPCAKLPLTVVLDNLRSAFNVGSVFRTSECLGVSRIYLCGYTATPEDEHTKKSSMGTDKYVDWEWRRGTLETIRELKGQGVTVVALETVRGKPLAHEFRFPRSGCALVLGNERHGLEADVLAECDEVVQLPCTGVKNSLNVACAFGMCCYEVVRQWRLDEAAQ